MTDGKIRVLIADDHAILRDGIRALLSPHADLEVVGEAEDGLHAIEACRRLDPDVLLLDVSMPGLGGVEAAIEIRKENQRVKILVLSQYDDREYVARFLKIGVSGYVLKKAAGADLANAIRAAWKGGLVLDPEVARDAFGAASRASGEGEGVDPYESLTDREKQVLKLVAEGKANKEIADDLGISVKTAMTHRQHMMEKLGLHGKTDVVKYAVKRGIVKI
jgi:DNA-binding NarL/FixJ family response regulator